MNKFRHVMQIGFTYIGTVVGAGFASGQEILKFFTQFGWIATLTIALASFLFIWIGIKLMLFANEIGAQSYEDLNKHLFGTRWGTWFSLFTLVILFGISTVMLAGAGSVFSEYFHLSYQTGLLITLILSYLILSRGLQAIITLNSFVVPIMIVFCCLTVYSTLDTPTASNWLVRSSDHMSRAWAAPFLYVAFNLATAQAVLVPLGASIKDRSSLVWGGIIGGVVIGFMLLAGHFALSANMPDIAQFEIPMSHLVEPLGDIVRLLFILVIFGEIFTTFVADVYGLILQIHQRFGWHRQRVLFSILICNYIISQVGFSELLSTLYPLFGLVSMVWFVMMIWKRSSLPLSR